MDCTAQQKHKLFFIYILSSDCVYKEVIKQQLKLIGLLFLFFAAVLWIKKWQGILVEEVFYTEH